jgi:hypothetical protein
MIPESTITEKTVSNGKGRSMGVFLFSRTGKRRGVRR